MSRKKRKKKRRRGDPSTGSRGSPRRRGQARLSICMIVRDEEKALPDCLQSIQALADEIVVVDTGSTDRTIAIAERYGARVFHFEWVDDFSAARNESIRHATGDWILWVDADDRIDPKYHRRIRQLLAQPRDRAFTFILENVGGDQATCTQIRLFPNLPGVQFSMPVHEQVTPSLARLGITRIVPVDVVVTHTGYTDPETVRRKKQKYLQIMTRWLVAHPEDYVTRAHVALTHHTWGQPDEAIREYQKIVQESPCQAENPYLYRYVLFFLGRSYMQKGAYDQAFATFDLAAQAEAEPTLIHLSLGECYHRLNQPEKAVEHLKYVRDHPMQRTYFPMELQTLHYAAHHFLGINLAKLGRFEEAILAYRAAIELMPDRLDAWLELAKFHQQIGAWDRAKATLQEALQHTLEHADIYHLLGVGALQTGQPKEAAEYFQRALALQPDHAQAAMNLGVATQTLGNTGEARRIYEQVLQRHPDHVDTLVNLAHLCLAEGTFESAQRYFWQVLTLEPGTLDVHLGMAWASAELGEIPQVNLAWQGILAHLPEEAWRHSQDATITADHFIQIAHWLREQSALRLAEYAVRTALALEPVAQHWELLGDLSYAGRRFQEALECYERALLIEPERKLLFHKLGDCYAALGVPEAAKIAREQAA